MVVYNFKAITTVPTGTDFIDVALSKTQRKTPTVVHPQYQIHRIRQFYMRKVKYTQQTFHDKLSQILTEFPILDDIHPFYADLMNILYDKDHYKLALGQMNMARNLIDQIGKDYLKLLKYGDSLYRCKQLKRAALGRMCTLMKKQSPSLAYLEQVRQHLGRLPSIDPNTRTLILCGYPNVGKSSFLNKVTKADVDVQPYPFTTKSLFVGHCDYKYLRWQVIDTPGILDHPLEQRNTIEMQSITAMAHLRASILFVMDISEQCGYSIEQQVNLFHSIKALFTNKPIMIVCNKIDVIRPEQLSAKDRQLIDSMKSSGEILPMSTMTEEGVMNVRALACDRLLEMRVETKLQGKKVADNLNRLHMSVPVPRDDKERPAFIPESVLKKNDEQMEVEMDEDEDESDKPAWLRGFNSKMWKKKYQLENPEWKFDIIPEIVDGKNIADFIDPEIWARLEELEKEEEARQEDVMNEMDEEDEEDIEFDEDDIEKVKEMRERRKLTVLKHRSDKGTTNHSILPKRTERMALSELESHLVEMGIDPSQAVDRIRSRSQSRVGRKRTRSVSTADPEDPEAKKRKERSASMTPAPGSGFKDMKQKMKADKMARESSRVRNKSAKKGEGDRVILNMMPKHLYTGTRGNGKTDRR